MRTETQERRRILKEFLTDNFDSFFTEDCETVTRISFTDEVVEIVVTVTASCGCCADFEYKEVSLDDFLENLSEQDFLELIDYLKTC